MPDPVTYQMWENGTIAVTFFALGWLLAKVPQWFDRWAAAEVKRYELELAAHRQRFRELRDRELRSRSTGSGCSKCE